MSDEMNGSGEVGMQGCHPPHDDDDDDDDDGDDDDDVMLVVGRGRHVKFMSCEGASSPDEDGEGV